MEPLRVVAELANGFASSDGWSPSIDGILARQVMLDRLGRGRFDTTDSVEMTPVEGVPLAVERWDDWWWYQCSVPVYHLSRVQEKHFHRRFPVARVVQYAAPQRGRVNVKSGKFKNSRKALLLRVTDEVVWHVVGDREAILHLLRDVTHIGKLCAHGYGRVIRWRVTAGSADTERLARFQRPLPKDFAVHHGIDGFEIYWGIRPPGRLKINRTLCRMPAISS